MLIVPYDPTGRKARPIMLGGLGCGCGCGSCGGGGPSMGALTVRVPVLGSGRPGETRRVTLGAVRVWVPVVGGRPGEARRITLGSLGLNPLEQNVASGVASKGAAVGAAAIATWAGVGTTVAPVIGTAIGAAVGLIASMVFGHHANYAQIAHDVAGQMAMAEAWKQVAGVYPGRVYGVQDMQNVWRGLLHEDFFKLNRSPQNCPVQQCIANPNSCIKMPGCGGTQAWVDDLFEGKAENPQYRSLTGAAKTAIAHGLTSIQAADQVFIPNWARQHDKFTIPWAYPNNTQSPTLARQLIIDTLDALMVEDDSTLPVWYGTMPASSAVQGQAAAPVVASSAGPAALAVVSPATQAAAAPAVQTSAQVPQAQYQVPSGGEISSGVPAASSSAPAGSTAAISTNPQGVTVNTGNLALLLLLGVGAVGGAALLSRRRGRK